MTRIIATPYNSDTKFINPILVNRGQWFGTTWLLQVAIANALNPYFVVEAQNDQAAIDEFIDSKWGHWITLSEEDAEDWHENDVIHGGNEGKPYLPHLISCSRCSVYYGDYLHSIYDYDAFNKWWLARLKDEVGEYDSVPTDPEAFSDKLTKFLMQNFRNDWEEYVEEHNSNKSDDKYNEKVALRETLFNDEE